MSGGGRAVGIWSGSAGTMRCGCWRMVFETNVRGGTQSGSSHAVRTSGTVMYRARKLLRSSVAAQATARLPCMRTRCVDG